ncbi:FAD-dependent oxidoreductase, partial [Candidatus Bipolaricaulota bacterium]|nr:FAD-dependent oxidoreductase [Candidatus Bipolaricaulota bacterium]
MEHQPGLECTIFFMDLRAFGKGFDAYYERAKELGVRFIRCRPSSVELVDETGDLRIEFINEQGHSVHEEFDLVVLSAGLQANADVRSFGERVGIDINRHGFASTGAFSPTESSRPGVFVCGAFSEPKDIPESVTDASGAAAQAMSLLAESRHTLVTQKEYPLEKDVSGQRPRIGVFVCHCGRNIGGVVDVPATVEFAETLPGVVYAEHNLYTCSSDTQDRIKELIGEHGLNRVIVASCTPRTHEPLFRDTIREAGLNPYLFEMANIRDQCSWVHMHEPETATVKAKELVRMAVAKARLIEPLHITPVPVTDGALVIGGGIAGMTAAVNLADQGFAVHLVEREAELGGHLRHVRYLVGGASDPQVELAKVISRVEAHPNITIWASSSVRRVDGFVGNFATTIAHDGQETLIEHGVVIVATGAAEHTPTEYRYGSDERVITQHELEDRLAEGKLDAKRVVMIQCVGSREGDRMYCSRVCCTQAVKNALKIKTDQPETDVYVLYRDLRTYGFREQYYTLARRSGVRFLRYEVDEKPSLSDVDGRLRVEAFDPVLNAPLEIDTDLLVLAPPIVPREDAEEVAQMLKVPLTAEGFFLEAHMKLRPIDFSADGIFLAGMAHSPKGVDETIAQAQATAARAATILSKDEYT